MGNGRGNGRGDLEKYKMASTKSQLRAFFSRGLSALRHPFLHDRQTFDLDWDSQQLFGWEKSKSDLVIESIIKGIEAGDDFPPVPVFSTHPRSSVFYLTTRVSGEHGAQADGGHYRAAGHYILNKPLKCILIPPPGQPSGIAKIAIPKIELADDSGEYALKKFLMPEYR